MMLCQRDVNIKLLVSDHVGKYTSKEFNDYLAKQGTNHRLTVHDTPESNGVTERLNRTLVERTHAMLLNSKLPKHLWGYAILHTNYMKNRTHTCALPNKMPYEMIHHKKPDLHATHEWGSDIYVKIDKKDKLSARAKTAKYIGFSSQSDGHCIYWPKLHKISIERNILFNKEKLHKYVPILPTEDDIQKTIQTAERS